MCERDSPNSIEYSASLPPVDIQLTNSSSIQWARTNTTQRNSKLRTCKAQPRTCPSFTCEWYGLKPKKSLSEGAITGVSIGAVFLLVLMICALVWWTTWSQKKKAVQGEREIEMDGVTILGDDESGRRVERVVEGIGRRGSTDIVVVVVAGDEKVDGGQRS